jgi:hypothetical protein
MIDRRSCRRSNHTYFDPFLPFGPFFGSDSVNRTGYTVGGGVGDCPRPWRPMLPKSASGLNRRSLEGLTRYGKRHPRIIEPDPPAMGMLARNRKPLSRAMTPSRARSLLIGRCHFIFPCMTHDDTRVVKCPQCGTKFGTARATLPGHRRLTLPKGQTNDSGGDQNL